MLSVQFGAVQRQACPLCFLLYLVVFVLDTPNNGKSLNGLCLRLHGFHPSEVLSKLSPLVATAYGTQPLQRSTLWSDRSIMILSACYRLAGCNPASTVRLYRSVVFITTVVAHLRMWLPSLSPDNGKNVFSE